MGWREITLITALVVLVHCDANQAVCKRRKTVVQLKIPTRSNITVKYPPKSEPVKFVPYPDNINADCFTCNGPQCRKCAATDNLSLTPDANTPKRTNIIIDLVPDISQPQSQMDNANNSSPSNRNSTLQKGGTILVVQDSSLASSASNSKASPKNDKVSQAAATSSSSAVMSNRDIIASFDQSSSGISTQDIYVEDDSQSLAGSTATSQVKHKSQNTSAKPGNASENAEKPSNNSNGTSPSA